MSMRKRLLLPAALLLCVAVAAPAEANYRVGIGDQNAAIFSQANYQALKIKRVRYLVPYDWYKHAGQKAEVAGYMAAARAARADVLVHFTARRGCFTSRGRYKQTKACRSPSVKTYKSSFKRFRKTYPYVKTLGVWNEANHVSQPTNNKPKLAAQYFLAARSACKSCTLVAADVLDIRNMTSWLRTFQRNAKGKAKIFGLHNYQDVNRKTSDGTRSLLAAVPGQVWLTETGGILTFLPSFPRNATRQANRTKYMFQLANRYKNHRRGLRSVITRLYNYQYTGAPVGARFDAGLTNPGGSKRKAYNTFKQYAARQPK
jgi:hypothetical protein